MNKKVLLIILAALGVLYFVGAGMSIARRKGVKPDPEKKSDSPSNRPALVDKIINDKTTSAFGDIKWPSGGTSGDRHDLKLTSELKLAIGKSTEQVRKLRLSVKTLGAAVEATVELDKEFPPEKIKQEPLLLFFPPEGGGLTLKPVAQGPIGQPITVTIE